MVVAAANRCQRPSWHRCLRCRPSRRGQSGVVKLLLTRLKRQVQVCVLEGGQFGDVLSAQYGGSRAQQETEKRKVADKPDLVALDPTFEGTAL